MPNQVQNPNKKPFNLEDRTAEFGKDIIIFLKTLSNSQINNPLINQLVRSATSIGANYMEADGAESKKDFRHKLGICKKESKESMHWLRMIAEANSDRKDECRILWKEAHELTLIFCSILNEKNKKDNQSDNDNNYLNNLNLNN
jgi:four helix bundle protein